jgi:hypothetical protein
MEEQLFIVYREWNGIQHLDRNGRDGVGCDAMLCGVMQS